MKAKELQIGDWVQFSDGNKKCTVVGIKCDARYLEDEAIITVMDRSGHWFDKEMDYLEPIPLTAEILEQNGFVTKDKPDYLAGYRSYTYKYSEGSTGLTFHLFHATGKHKWSGKCEISLNSLPYCIRFEYLHELQHILKICGIDKEIKLEG